MNNARFESKIAKLILLPGDHKKVYPTFVYMTFVGKSNVSHKCSRIFDRDVLEWFMQNIVDTSS